MGERVVGLVARIHGDGLERRVFVSIIVLKPEREQAQHEAHGAIQGVFHSVGISDTDNQVIDAEMSEQKCAEDLEEKMEGGDLEARQPPIR